ATGTAGDAAVLAAADGPADTVVVAGEHRLEALVTDTLGNPVAGTGVVWTVEAGDGSLSADSTATDAAGIAAVTWTVGATAGPQRVEAAAAGLAGSPLDFAVEAVPAAGALYEVMAADTLPTVGDTVI